MQRLFIGLGLGGLATFGLFVIMAFLVKTELLPPEKGESVPIQIAMVEPEDDLKVMDRRMPRKPPPPKNPPPPRKQRIAKAPKPTMPNTGINMGDMEIGVTGGTYMGQMGGAMSDGEAIPMVVIEPRYPRKAAMEGIEGWVRFEFTVDADGSPKDIRVIEANPKRVFERDARKAIYKWKFKPKVVDGKAVAQPGMRYTMEFKMGAE